MRVQFFIISCFVECSTTFTLLSPEESGRGKFSTLFSNFQIKNISFQHFDHHFFSFVYLICKSLFWDFPSPFIIFRVSSFEVMKTIGQTDKRKRKLCSLSVCLSGIYSQAFPSPSFEQTKRKTAFSYSFLEELGLFFFIFLCLSLPLSSFLFCRSSSISTTWISLWHTPAEQDSKDEQRTEKNIYLIQLLETGVWTGRRCCEEIALALQLQIQLQF